LVVYADAVLAPPVARECFQPIAAQCCEVFEASRRLEAVKPDLCLSCETRELLDALAAGKPFGPAVPVAYDHR
jgi:hypothetical protein